MLRIIKTCLLTLAVIFTCTAQSEQDKEYYDNYNKRIAQTRINGVYIPKDLDDAFTELMAISESAGIEKFKAGEESVVAQKLKGGLGRWMLINWGFHEGSRLSHHIKELGVFHPEDMAQFLIVSFHRHLNDRPLDVDNQALHYQNLRKIEYNSQIKRDTIPVND